MTLLQMLLRSYAVIKHKRGIHFTNDPSYRVSRTMISVPLHPADVYGRKMKVMWLCVESVLRHKASPFLFNSQFIKIHICSYGTLRRVGWYSPTFRDNLTVPPSRA